MRKPIVIALAAAVVLLLGASVLLYGKYRRASADYSAMKAEEEATRARYGEAIDEIATIQDSLDAIVLGEEGRMIPSQLQAEQRVSETQGDLALARVAALKAGLERTRSRIQDLDQRLKRSAVRVRGLEKMVAGLKRNLAEKEQLVEQLGAQVASLETRVTGLVAEVQQKDAKIEEKRRELGTVFYTIGTRKDLTTAGVVVAKGGILGLGRTLEPSGQVNEDVFTALDTDRESVIRIPAAKARVLSAQPPTSYQLQLIGEQLELRILDSEKFRAVKHVVILTT